MAPSDTQQRRSLKYIRLAAFFAKQANDTDELALSVDQIEELVGQPLPGNARFPSWWRNDDRKMHSRAWMTAGWEVAHMDVDSAEVIFRRTPSPEPEDEVTL